MTAGLVDIALRWLEAGYSVIPVLANKRPAISEWKPYQTRAMTIEEAERAFARRTVKGVAVVGGYNNVFAFDFDPDKLGIAHEPFDIETDFYTPWSNTVEGHGITPAVQYTPSGGYHAIIRCPKPHGNEKLAQVPAAQKPHATIETRGVGGYFLIYDHNLDPASVPMLTDEQYQVALEAAVTLDRLPTPTGAQAPARASQGGGSGKKATATRDGLVGWFNKRYNVQDILLDHGYRQVGNKFLAPASTSGNAGVVLFEDEYGQELCYSHHGDALGDGHAHDAFDTFKVLVHGGDFNAAKDAVVALKSAGRFTFGTGASRARGDNFSLSTNASNAVTDATTICAHGLSTNQEMSTNEPDLSSNTPTNEHKSKNAVQPAISGKNGSKLRKRSDLSSNGEHKYTGPSPSQKLDLSSNETEHQSLPSITRWGERDRPPDVQWAIHNLIQDNAENLIAGEPGVGKSWISGDLAVAIATGSAFLDRPTQQGRVMLINFDDPSESLLRMFAERAARGREYRFSELDIFYWQPEEGRPYPAEGIGTPYVFEFLKSEIERIKPRLIIVDAFSSAFPHLDGNKGQDAITAFEILRQLRTSAPKPCAMVLVDHTPKATLQDSKRRGVSGSQQKHAKTRTVHIIRHVDPGEVNGDDVLEWEVFKANAAPRQEPFGVNREMDSLLNTAKLTTRQLPERGPGGKNDRAAKAAVAILRGRPNEAIGRQDLLAEVVALANVSMATARRGLASNLFVDHPQIRVVDMGGRGNPQGFMFEPDPISARVSLFEQFKTIVFSPDYPDSNRDAIRDLYRKADAGDEDAKDRLDHYLSRDDTREWLATEYPKYAPKEEE